MRLTTRVRANTLAPGWFQEFAFPVLRADDALCVYVRDKTRTKILGDPVFGEGRVERVGQLPSFQPQDVTLKLCEKHQWHSSGKTIGSRGAVRLKLRWEPNLRPDVVPAKRPPWQPLLQLTRPLIEQHELLLTARASSLMPHS